MTTFSFRRTSSKPATQFERQKVTKPGRVIKASLFCVIVLCLSIVPFSAAAGQGSGGSGVAVIGPSSSSTPYPCTTAGIQHAISDAINHPSGSAVTQSIVDASNCTTLTITSEIYIGVANEQQLNQRIKFIVPANGTWTATMNDGAHYALKFGNGAMIYGGLGSGEGQPFSIHAGSGSSLHSVCGNDPTYGTYFHAEGFSCVADAGSTVQYAILEIANSADESYAGHLGAYALGGTVPWGLWVHGSCCSATFEDINADMGNQPGALPCAFGFPPYDINAGIHVSKLSCVHPGSGKNAMLIQQTGGSNGLAIGNSFSDIYMEQARNGSQDNTTPWVAVRQSGAAFPAADLLEGLRATIDTAGSTRYVVDIGTGSRVNISNLGLSNTSTNAINDGVSAVTVTGAVNSVIASYDMTPRYHLMLGATTVTSLPPAASNPGAMSTVSDSTPITTEGQPCAGGGSNNALAFSNGSVWKCF
jgi:hypothetical protein